MFSYVVGAAVLTHAMPSVWSWGWWGASALWKTTYWLCYGRTAEKRRQAQLEAFVQQSVRNAISDEYELALGGTDVILVRKNK